MRVSNLDWREGKGEATYSTSPEKKLGDPGSKLQVMFPGKPIVMEN
jgi:hypothetical protein